VCHTQAGQPSRKTSAFNDAALPLTYPSSILGEFFNRALKENTKRTYDTFFS